MGLKSSNNQLKEIVDLLEDDVIRPSKSKAAKIVSGAEDKGEEIISSAKDEAERILNEAREHIEREKLLHDGDLKKAVKSSLNHIKAGISSIFSDKLDDMISSEMKKSVNVAKIIDAIIDSLKRDGIDGDLLLHLPNHISTKDLTVLLSKRVSSEISKHGKIEIGEIGGVELKLVNRKMSIDVSDKAVKDLLHKYLTSALRGYIFE